MRPLHALILTAALCCASCSPRLYPTGQTHETTAAKTDSVYVRDSIYIDHWNTIREKGDTVFVTQKVVEYRDRWKERIVRDTLRTVEHETVTQYVEKELNWWQKFQIWAGRVLLAIAAGLLVYAVVKIFIK